MPLALVLFIVFLVLKLCEVIAWSWIWVTAPLWLPVLFVLVVIALGGSLAAALGVSEKKRRRKNVIRKHYPR